MKKIARKIISALLILIMVMSVAPLGVFDFTIKSSALEASGQCGDNVYWTFDESTGLLTISGTGDMYDYSNVNDDYSPFYNNDYIKSIKIEDGITSIGSHIFYNCSKVENVTISDTIINIKSNAFQGLFCLKKINIPNNVKSIEKWAFCACHNLESVTIPSSVINIGTGLFSTCFELKSISVDENNSVYDSRENCNAIIETKTNILIQGCKNTAIPNSVEIIAYAAFDTHYYTEMTDLIIPEGVKTIRTYAFKGCIGLKNISIPKSVTKISDYVFSGCNNLKCVYYAGSEEDWKKIAIDGNNDNLVNAIFHYNHTHTYTSKITIPADCENDGLKTYTCECGDTYTETINATGHKHEKVVTPPDCTHQGYTTYTCTCGDTYVDDYVDALGHDFGEWKVTKPATYYEEGERTLYCETCKEPIKTEPIPKLVMKSVRDVKISDVTLKYQKTAKITPDITADEGAKYSVEYKSSNEKVAEVDENGNIITKGKGTATITCTVTDEFGNTVKDTCTVTVEFTFSQWLIWIFLLGFLWY